MKGEVTLPKDTFKRASDIECAKHEFEIGRLRNLLLMKVVPIELKGKQFYITADPLNDKYLLSDTIPDGK